MYQQNSFQKPGSVSSGSSLALTFSPPKSEHQMKSRLFLDVVLSQRPAIFKLLARKYQALLIRWNSFLVLLVDSHLKSSHGLMPNSVE